MSNCLVLSLSSAYMRNGYCESWRIVLVEAIADVSLRFVDSSSLSLGIRVLHEICVRECYQKKILIVKKKILKPHTTPLVGYITH